MSVRHEFDAWAADGRDRGMEDRHWHTAKHALARLPIEAGDAVLDLGSGSGYVGRALRETTSVGSVYGLDGSAEMVRNARSYAEDPGVSFLQGDFGTLPFDRDTFDHAFSMEAFYYASDPHETLRELARVLRPGGTFHCAVNYYEESVHSADWQENIDVSMTRWDMPTYREAFRDAGLHVAAQDTIPDREIEIPPAEEFPTEDWETREDMIERYREFGTLVTIGVVP
jgi:ubiquinone/menaquinone biosynthesis C-methylase UbiE